MASDFSVPSHSQKGIIDQRTFLSSLRKSSCAFRAGAFHFLNQYLYIHFTVKRISAVIIWRSRPLRASLAISDKELLQIDLQQLVRMYLILYLPFQQFKRFSPGPGQHHAHTARLYMKRIRDLLVCLLKEVESKGKDLCASLSRKDRPQRRSCISRNNFIVFSRL